MRLISITVHSKIQGVPAQARPVGMRSDETSGPSDGYIGNKISSIKLFAGPHVAAFVSSIVCAWNSTAGIR
jgi:hypothetical protein